MTTRQINRSTSLLGLSLVLGLLGVPFVAAAAGLDTNEVGFVGEHPLEPPDTSSPRATLQTFVQDMNAGWQYYLEHGNRRPSRVAKAHRCLDLEAVPSAQVQDVALETSILLLDVLNRIPLPAPEEIPDADQMRERGQTRWTVPHTSIDLELIQEGPRAGEWLFSRDLVQHVKDYYLWTRHLPVKSDAVIEDGYQVFMVVPGWMIPAGWIAALPSWAHRVWLEQTVWQWALFALVLTVATWAAVLCIRMSRRDGAAEDISKWRRVWGPVSSLLIAALALYLLDEQVNISGTVSVVLRNLLVPVCLLSAAWGLLLAGGIVADAIIASPKILPKSLDAHLIRMCTRLAAFILALLIVMQGLHSMGVSVVGLVAGLSVGGLALALAAQGSVENFIGSLTLYLDRPLRVGDFCRYGDDLGTIEEIGLRSTRIRGIDRTVSTIPNADFSKMKLTNLTKRDRMMLRTVIQLRYETTAEQLRYVLAKLRELLLAHPKVTPDPARARFIGFGAASLDVEIFAYVATSDWGEFLAIQEDICLRMMDIVAASGTSFAFPSQTLYLSRDQGLNSEKSKAAEAEVDTWRREKRLPFPEFDLEFRQTHRDSLDYPPEGSAHGEPPASQSGDRSRDQKP